MEIITNIWLVGSIIALAMYADMLRSARGDEVFQAYYTLPKKATDTLLVALTGWLAIPFIAYSSAQARGECPPKWTATLLSPILKRMGGRV